MIVTPRAVMNHRRPSLARDNTPAVPKRHRHAGNAVGSIEDREARPLGRIRERPFEFSDGNPHDAGAAANPQRSRPLATIDTMPVPGKLLEACNVEKCPSA